MAVVSNDGGNWDSVASDSPGNGGRNPLCSAMWRVEIVRGNKAAWANATKSAGVLGCLLIAGAAMCSWFPLIGSSVVCPLW